jgi:hypothetical protein
MTVWHSGSVRYYGHRLTVAWDGFPPQDLDRTVTFFEQHGYTPYFLLEASEEPTFRARFARASALAALDWPPVAAIRRDVRIFRAGDRRVYFDGGSIRTDHVW